MYCDHVNYRLQTISLQNVIENWFQIYISFNKAYTSWQLKLSNVVYLAIFTIFTFITIF